MNLQEQTNRIKQMMGLLIEEENQPVTKGANHGVVIKQPYQQGQEGESLNSFIIGITHFDEKNPVYLELDDIDPSIINDIKQVATNCGYYYEGVGGDDLKNIERFFKEELKLNVTEEMRKGSYEPKINNDQPDKKYFMYTFFSNGNAVDEKTKAKLDGINQDKILLDQLSILKNNGQKINSINDLTIDKIAYTLGFSKNFAIIEEFLFGKEYTFESIVIDSKLYPITASKKDHFFFGVANSLLYSDANLEFLINIGVSDFFSKYIKLSGFKNGFLHAELIVIDNKEFKLVEVACRGGGTNISSLILSTIINKSSYECLWNFKSNIERKLDTNYDKTHCIELFFFKLTLNFDILRKNLKMNFPIFLVSSVSPQFDEATRSVIV
jgi:hypothetical protein